MLLLWRGSTLGGGWSCGPRYRTSCLVWGEECRGYSPYMLNSGAVPMKGACWLLGWYALTGPVMRAGPVHLNSAVTGRDNHKDDECL